FDGVVTAQILDTRSPGALTHKVSEQVDCKTSAEIRQSSWPKAKTIKHDTVYAQATVLGGLRGKLGVSAIDNGWAVTHASVSMNEAIAAYQGWFDQAGLTLSASPTGATANVAPYNLSGLADELRVIFHREGSGVRVYIGAR